MNTISNEQILELQNLSALWSIGSSIASIVLAIVAIVLAVYFYTQAKKSEKEVSNSLNKIEAQSQALEKITGRQIERLTKHLTERKSLDEIHPDLKLIANMASSYRQDISSQSNDGNSERLQTIKYMIGTYYYCAIANYYAFMSLPEASNFDEENHFHVTTKNTLDLTANDISYVKKQFEDLGVTDEEIKQSGLENLYKEAIDVWIPSVKNSSSSFIKIQEFKKNA